MEPRLNKMEFIEVSYSIHYLNQIILPVNSVQTIRTLSAFVDDASNIAIVSFMDTTTTHVRTVVLNNVNNGVSGIVYGIK